MPRRKIRFSVSKKELKDKIEKDLIKEGVKRKRVSKKNFKAVNDMIVKAVEESNTEMWFNYINEFVISFVKMNKGKITNSCVNISKSDIYKGIASTYAYFKDRFYSIFVSMLPHKGYNIYLSKFVDGEFTEPIKMCYNKDINKYKIKEDL